VNINTVNSLFGLNIKSTAEMNTWLKNVQEPCKARSGSQIDECADAEAMAISRVGRELYHLIFKPYTLKQWGVMPSELDASVTARIPVRDNHDPRYFADRYQLLPSKGYTLGAPRRLSPAEGYRRGSTPIQKRVAYSIKLPLLY